jgi:hypothetical protein
LDLIVCDEVGVGGLEVADLTTKGVDLCDKQFPEGGSRTRQGSLERDALVANGEREWWRLKLLELVLRRASLHKFYDYEI